MLFILRFCHFKYYIACHIRIIECRIVKNLQEAIMTY
jgi:hypothetical protein